MLLRWQNSIAKTVLFYFDCKLLGIIRA